MREATSETYGPRVYLLSYKFPIYFTLQSLLSIYIIKIPKIFILSLLSLSDLTVVCDREGIDNPFIVLVARFLFVCVGTRDLRVASYWIDTLVLKNWGKYLCYFATSPFPLQGKTNGCSRGSSKQPIKFLGNPLVIRLTVLRLRIMSIDSSWIGCKGSTRGAQGLVMYLFKWYSLKISIISISTHERTLHQI